MNERPTFSTRETQGRSPMMKRLWEAAEKLPQIIGPKTLHGIWDTAWEQYVKGTHKANRKGGWRSGSSPPFEVLYRKTAI